MSGTDPTRSDDVVLMAALATRLRMTEGQVYTAIVGVLVVLLLTVTGLPRAHDLVPAASSSSAPAPPAPAAPAPAATPTTVAPVPTTEVPAP